MKRFLLILIGVAVFYSLQAVYAQNVEYVGEYDTPGIARAVYVSGDYAYVGKLDSVLLILDVSDPSNPAPAGSLQTRYSARDVCVSGNYAFVAEGIVNWIPFGTLEVVDVSDPTSPDSVGDLGLGRYDFCKHVFVSRGYVYLSYQFTSIEDTYGHCTILDVSIPSDPTYLSYFGCYVDIGSCTIGDVFVSGDYAYVYSTFYSGGIGLLIEDISDPENPFDVGSYMFHFDGIFVDGDYAYLAGYEAGLRIVNVSEPSDPYLVGEFDTPGRARDVFVSGHFAYVADGDSGLQVIDISQPADPVLAGSYDTPGDAWRVCVQGDYTYVADSSSLMILRFNPQTGIEDPESTPARFALKQNYPNPFNASTEIYYDIPVICEADISVYDALGRLISTLFRGQKEPGHYGIVWDAGDNASGIYFARLQTEWQTEVIRMTLLK